MKKSIERVIPQPPVPPASEHLRGVGVHPHKGFETVTIAYKGSVAHHDSAGNSGTIHPGDVQWMTAGAGILHKEYHDEEYAQTGGPFEMVQLWVNLPKVHKSVPAHYTAPSHRPEAKTRSHHFHQFDRGLQHRPAGHQRHGHSQRPIRRRTQLHPFRQ